ncbi:UNKNOWN [Stylonychia lemnae]|uniref:Uncharacterized protein n=1 Tax=Stylonychia lemnae TaxID=5949 RepID=A0A078AK65_STYLE|nr:UNKNOWN [Stylonychia lemnae]|eukprot:CDW82574.1 UNKNOWN [Stylonychia lemnae]
MQLDLLQHGLSKKRDNDQPNQLKMPGQSKKQSNTLENSSKYQSNMKISRDSNSLANDAVGSQNQSRIKKVISKISGKKQEQSINQEIITPRTPNQNDQIFSHHKINAHVSTTINSDTLSYLSLLMVPKNINKQDQANLTAIHTNSNYLKPHKNHLIQKLQSIQSQKRQERYPQYRQDSPIKDDQPRKIKMKINLVRQNKFQHISFDYNIDSDTPDLIAQEMQENLQLDQDDTN